MVKVFEMFRQAVNEQAWLDLTDGEVNELMEIFREMG
jgi:hypothetical protein